VPHFEFTALTLLLIQIAVIMGVSRALGLVTRRLGQPLVIAEVVAGIVLGPSLLGLVWPQGMAALFPTTSLPVLKMLSQVGLVLFMFLVGLEFDPKLLRGRAHSSVAISHTSIVLPFILGAGAAFWMYEEYSDPSVSFTAFLLFMGTAMSVTAFPVLARILSERHLLSSRVGAIAIASAAIDDVTAWCILAFVVAVARANGLEQAVWTTGFAVAFILTMLLVVRPFLGRLSARVSSREGLAPGAVAFALFLLLVSATTTELIGIHSLFGAFMFGAVLPKEGHLAEALADKIEAVAVVLLLPLFFAFSGLRTEIGLVSAPREWLVTGVVVALATVGKFGGSAVAARLTGLRWREASAIGILMNTRGLMELIVLNLGMDLGVISPTVFTMLVIMALVTTFATAPILRFVYPDEELARDRMAPPIPMTSVGKPAFTVMMCVSDGKVGPALAKLASALMGKREEPVHLFALHLLRSTDRPSVERKRGNVAEKGGPLAPLLSQAADLTLDVRPLSFVSSNPPADITRTAQAKQASLVLMGAHKPLLLEGRLSGTVGDVVSDSSCPVAVFVDRGLSRVERVLVAYAGGPEDLAALQLARRIGRAPGIELTLFHVVQPDAADQSGRGRGQIDQVFSEPADGGTVRLRFVTHSSPADAVLEESRNGYDLLVLGMHARWGLEKGMLSLRRRRVLSESPVSILAVHPPALGPEAAAEPAPSELAGSTV
jgi:Kef-type K+ transport system membrane component KefB/nucleotide-binding universal stress UspA family protein